MSPVVRVLLLAVLALSSGCFATLGGRVAPGLSVGVSLGERVGGHGPPHATRHYAHHNRAHRPPGHYHWNKCRGVWEHD